MRDINRIDGFCDDLKGIWKQVPDWRFMQLMSNFFRYSFGENGRDPYFMEEERALEDLKAFLKYTNGGE